MQGIDIILISVVLSVVTCLLTTTVVLFIISNKQKQDMQKRMDYFYQLFREHFKTTDKTINDLRKERDELKIELAKLK